MAAGEEKKGEMKGEMKEERRGKEEERRERKPGDTSAAVQVVSYPLPLYSMTYTPNIPYARHLGHI